MSVLSDRASERLVTGSLAGVSIAVTLCYIGGLAWLGNTHPRMLLGLVVVIATAIPTYRYKTRRRRRVFSDA